MFRCELNSVFAIDILIFGLYLSHDLIFVKLDL